MCPPKYEQQHLLGWDPEREWAEHSMYLCFWLSCLPAQKYPKPSTKSIKWTFPYVACVRYLSQPWWRNKYLVSEVQKFHLRFSAPLGQDTHFHGQWLIYKIPGPELPSPFWLTSFITLNVWWAIALATLDNFICFSITQSKKELEGADCSYLPFPSLSPAYDISATRQTSKWIQRQLTQ